MEELYLYRLDLARFLPLANLSPASSPISTWVRAGCEREMPRRDPLLNPQPPTSTSDIQCPILDPRHTPPRLLSIRLQPIRTLIL